MKTFEELYNRLPLEIRTEMKNCIQDKIFHPEGSCEKHTEIVFNNVLKLYSNDENLPELLIAAIFHDLGKPETKEVKIKDNIERISHINHEYKSLDYIDKYFHLYSDITTNKEMVYEIVKMHMRIHLYNDLTMKKFSKRKALEDNKYFDVIMKFSHCDQDLIN